VSASVDAHAEAVRAAVLAGEGAEAGLRVRAGGTKGALSGGASLELEGVSGVTQYDPQEYTFTALAGTPVCDAAKLLGQHGQELPFDPPLADAGATLGGTVAAGLSGPGRYRYGGVRDFLLGVRFVAGDGRVVTGGGKVVKNAAGFDLPKLMVGSLGRFGVLLELTFKVFPRPAARATLRLELPTLREAVAAMQVLGAASFDLTSLELDPPGTLLVRVAGTPDALPARLERLQASLGRTGALLVGDADDALWRARREFAWAGAGCSLVKVSITSALVERLDGLLAATGADVRRAYGVGGDVAYLAWPDAAERAPLVRLLDDLARPALALTGSWSSPVLGRHAGAAFAERVASVLDPHGAFAPRDGVTRAA
jgi:glycolate oxidase FAD binding subunit